jgi:hypothetical protein
MAANGKLEITSKEAVSAHLRDFLEELRKITKIVS